MNPMTYCAANDASNIQKSEDSSFFVPDLSSEPENQYFEQEEGVVEDYEKIAEMQHFYSRL